MEKRQLLNDEYHGQQPPAGWLDHHTAWSFIYLGARGVVELWHHDDSAPTSALYRPAVEWQGLTNARRAGWAV